MKRWGLAFAFALLVHAGMLWGLSTWELTPPTMSMKSGATSIEMAFQTRTPTAPENVSKPVEKQKKPPEKTKSTEEPTPKPPKKPEKISPPNPMKHGDTRRKEIMEQPEVEEPTNSPPEPTPEESPGKIMKKPTSLPEEPPDKPVEESEPTEKQNKTSHQREQNQSEQEQVAKEQKQTESEAEKESPATESSENHNLRESARSEGATWVEDPSYVSNPSPEYPYQARIRGIEGRVTLLVEINENGLPVMIEVHQSSGSYILDEAAVETVREWKFEPAVENENPVVARTLIPIRFTLDR